MPALVLADGAALPPMVLQAIRPDGTLSAGVPRGDLIIAQAIVTARCRPGGIQAYEAAMRLRATARRREGHEVDEKLARAAYADALAPYPPDVVATACAKIQASSPFWPAISELVQACEREMQPRRSLLRSIIVALAEPKTEPETEEQRLQASIRIWRYRQRPERAARYERALVQLQQHDGTPA